MSSRKDLDMDKAPPVIYGSLSVSELVEETTWLHNITRDNKDSTEAQDMVCKQAVWRLRNSKRDTHMFLLRRAGELVMGTTIASLGALATAQSLGDGRIEGTVISIFGIIWSLGVCREVVKDFNSPEYMELVNNLAREHIYHDATMAMLEINI